MSALNVFALCFFASLVWTAHELSKRPENLRTRAVRRLSAPLLGVNVLKYALPPLMGGELVLPVEFSAAAYFTTPAIPLFGPKRLRCWAAYAGLLAGSVYYSAMVLAGDAIYGAYPPSSVLLSLFCHGSLLVLGLIVTGTESFTRRETALLPLGVAAVAVRAALLRPWSGGGTLLIYELLDARILRSALPAGSLSAALGVYYLTMGVMILLSARLYLAVNRASLRRGEEHLKVVPV